MPEWSEDLFSTVDFTLKCGENPKLSEDVFYGLYFKIGKKQAQY